MSETNNMTDSQKQAVEQKELGNEAYKKKDFTIAHTHYDKGIQLDPANITIYTNKAAAFFEENKHKECIDLCMKAVEIGRQNRADYKFIAKAYLRAANAHLALKEPKQALCFYDKSLSEHRDASVVKKRAEVGELLKEEERVAYLDPQQSLAEKEKGNEYFKGGDFPNAMKHYSEAIKRNPDDAKLYSNRAACYTKLMEFRLALLDCEACLRLDNKFVKGYIRKGLAHQALKEYSKGAQEFEEALKLDPNSQEATVGLSACMRADSGSKDEESVKRNVMNNPEVQQILSDPAMRMILEQMQSDPKAVQEHLANPAIKEKLVKLMESGVIQMR